MLTRGQKRKSETDGRTTKRLSIVLEDIRLSNEVTWSNDGASIVVNSASSITNDEINHTEEVTVQMPQESIDTSHSENANDGVVGNSDEEFQAKENDDEHDDEVMPEAVRMPQESIDTSQSENANDGAVDNSDKEIRADDDENEHDVEVMPEAVGMAGQPTEYKMVPGKRFGTTLLETPDGYLFKKNKPEASGKIPYTCQKKECTARVELETENGQCTYTKRYIGHNHVNPKMQQLQVDVEDEMKQRAKKPQLNGSKFETCSEIFHSVMAK